MSVLLINASPRGEESFSALYSQLLAQTLTKLGLESCFLCLAATSPVQAAKQMLGHQQVVLLCPLSVDSLPVPVLTLLGELAPLSQFEEQLPRLFLIVHCGFLESRQNACAIEILRQFAALNGFPWGGSLAIGGGQIPPQSRLFPLLERKLTTFGKSLRSGRRRELRFQPLVPQFLRLEGNTDYWLGLAGDDLTPDAMAADPPSPISPKRSTLP